MKKVILLVSCIVCLNQSSQIITLKEYYCGKGVIFNKEYEYPFKDSKYRQAFTPTLSQIKRAEDIFYLSYYEHRKKILDSFKSNYKISKRFKISKNVKRNYKKYYRQYSGYIDITTDSIIHISLFNFSDEKKASQYFEKWDSKMLLGSGKYYEENQEFYLVNISKEKLVIK